MSTITLPSSVSLSSHDSKILNALFDAESSISSISIPVQASQASLPHVDEQTFTRLRAVEHGIIQSLLPNSQPTIDKIELAINSFSALIDEHPAYASAYLNRAQALRLLLESKTAGLGAAANKPNSEDTDIFSPAHRETMSNVFSDLDLAISLASPPHPTDAISSHQRSILAAAHTHRGFLYMKAARATTDSDLLMRTIENSTLSMGISSPYSGKTKDELEELASRDFAAGGRYGDEVARDMAVRTNPYAKMCGAIVKEAMRREVVESGIL